MIYNLISHLSPYRNKWCFLAIILKLATISFSIKGSVPDSLQLPLELIGADQGLSQGMVNDIIQDHTGLLWFATKDGLNMFDGYQFSVYRNIANDSTSLSENYVNVLFEDNKNRFWIGTATNGLEYFNRSNSTFENIQLDSYFNTSSNCIIRIDQDKHGNLWVGTIGGLFKVIIDETAFNKSGGLDVSKLKILHYFSTTVPFSITHDGILYGVSDIYTPFRIYPGEGANDNIDTTTFKVFFQSHKYKDLAAAPIGAFVEDTTTNLIYYFNSRAFFTLNHRTGECKEVYSRYKQHPILTAEALLDEKGKIWITNSAQLEIFDPKTQQLQIVVPKNKEITEASLNIRRIYKSRDGNFWLGTLGYGVLKYSPSLDLFHTVTTPSIRFLRAFEGTKVHMIASNSLFSVFDIRKNNITHHFSDSVYISKFGFANWRPSNSLIKDQHGNVYVNNNSLIKVNAGYTSLDTIGYKTALGQAIETDSKGDLWFGTIRGISSYSSETEITRHWEYPFSVSQDPYFFVQCIYLPDDGTLWIGSNNGLIHFNPSKQEWNRYNKIQNDSTSLSNNIIFCLLPDPHKPKKYLWIGTNGGGLCRFDFVTKKFNSYSEKDGLPNNVIYGILDDNSNNLWLSTNKGLSKFDLSTSQFENHDVKEGLQDNEFNRYAYCKMPDGTLVFGGVKGFTYFNPQEIKSNNNIPNIIITAIRLKNKVVDFLEPGSPLSKPAYLSNSITIDHTENMISFEFAALDYTLPGRNQFQYMLKGFDKEWITAGHVNNAIYTNLDPGSYTFMVKGANNDGFWNEVPAKILLQVRPSWYMTWWFRTGIFGIVILSIYLFIRYRFQQELKLQKLRNRIASDLHDEIGSTLSSISLYSEAARKLIAQNQNADTMVQKISESSRTMMEALSDIVWTINTKNDSLEVVINKIRAYASEGADASGCKLHFNESVGDTKLSLTMDQRKNIFLIFKEAINNAFKYSDCLNLYISFERSSHMLNCMIRDDGKGFDITAVSGGNGLQNMTQRADAIGATLTIHSAPGAGSEVVLKLKI